MRTRRKRRRGGLLGRGSIDRQARDPAGLRRRSIGARRTRLERRGTSERRSAPLRRSIGTAMASRRRSLMIRRPALSRRSDPRLRWFNGGSLDPSYQQVPANPVQPSCEATRRFARLQSGAPLQHFEVSDCGLGLLSEEDMPRAPAISPGPWRVMRPSPLRGSPEIIPRGALAPGERERAITEAEGARGPARGESLSRLDAVGPQAKTDRVGAIRQAREAVAPAPVRAGLRRRTDGSGSYSFTGLPDGTYTVCLEIGRAHV